MNFKPKSEQQVRALVADALIECQDEYGETDAFVLSPPDGEAPEDASSFAIELADGSVYAVEIAKVRGPKGRRRNGHGQYTDDDGKMIDCVECQGIRLNPRS